VPYHFHRNKHEVRTNTTGVWWVRCGSQGATERHRVAYRLHIAAERPDEIRR